MNADPGFDVFVSYAHADNGVALGSSVEYGWVTALTSNLNVGPNVLQKKFFIDHKLQPGDPFSTELLSVIERSSLLVLVLSQNYIESKWCGKELEHFLDTRCANPDQPTDVFVVELFPYDLLTGVPPAIALLRKRLTAAKFWYQLPDAASPSLAGYPSAQQSGDEGDRHYWRLVNEFRGALDARLRQLRCRSAPAAAQPAGPVEAGFEARPRDNGPERLGTVLLADCTDDLEAQRTATRLALEPEGIEVLPETDYVGMSPTEFEAAFRSDLARADCFVQLLSPTVGRKARGFEVPMPQLQFQRAVAIKTEVLQWCERLPAPGQVSDPAHARLFETEFLRATNLSEFQTGVIDRLRSLRAQRERAATRAESHLSRRSKRLIFVDDAAGGSVLSERLRSVIREQNYSVRSLPPGVPLGNNGIDIKELLRPCRAGITVYGDRAKYTTALNRLIYFLNQVADGSLPLARWGVLLEQGASASEFDLKSDEVISIDERGLSQFLNGL